MNTLRLDWKVVRLLCISVVASTGTSTSAEVFRIISPSAQENVEGDLFARPSSAPNRIQFLFPASDFASLPASRRWLVAFNSRGDDRQTPAVDWVFPDSEIGSQRRTRPVTPCPRRLPRTTDPIRHSFTTGS
jgi:hypothetical protein